MKVQNLWKYYYLKKFCCGYRAELAGAFIIAVATGNNAALNRRQQ